jgi:copper chaperone NosL
MNRPIAKITRIIAALCGIGLLVVIFLPLWRIELDAPQYPEGLVLKIYPDRLGGDVDVVNGLNHYIGMRTLHAKDFVEFTVLPWIIGILGVFGLLSALVNKRWFFATWVVLFLAFAVVAMADFYRWEYNYGHNLDDTAPIKVPGMAYQPPLIGYKKLLNFGAWSVPDAGGWIFIVVGVALAVTLFLELRGVLKITKRMEIKVAGLIFIFFSFGFMACQSGPAPIKYGQDACDFCRMTISDNRFGCEWVNTKGKASRFDDIHCLAAWMKKEQAKTDKGKIYLTDFAHPGTLQEAAGLSLLKSDALKSPMGGNIAAFASKEDLNKFIDRFPGKEISLSDALSH